MTLDAPALENGLPSNAANPATPFKPLPEITGGWRCILADVPLRFRSNSEAKPGRNAMRHYACMSAEALAALPVKRIAARDALLFYWTTGPVIATGAHVVVMQAWGFEPTTLGFANPRAPSLFLTERDFAFGPGLTTRKNCEFVVLGRRGKPERLARDVAELVIAPRREHSRKPDEVYLRIERYCVGPRLELFAREGRRGWTAWGDETSRFDRPWAEAAE
jgi:N6-adenosine-specific RNA methylase IME4